MPTAAIENKSGMKIYHIEFFFISLPRILFYKRNRFSLICVEFAGIVQIFGLDPTPKKNWEGGGPLPMIRDYLFFGIMADNAPTMFFMSMGSPVG